MEVSSDVPCSVSGGFFMPFCDTLCVCVIANNNAEPKSAQGLSGLVPGKTLGAKTAL